MLDSVQNKLQKDFKGKKVLIVGLGLQGGGAGLAQFLSRIGAEVKVTDKKKKEELSESLMSLRELPISFHLGGHQEKDFISADVIFKGPSVPWYLPEIASAQKKGIPIEMEAAYVVSLFPKQIIGVTGTRGKSTTVQLLYEIIKKSGKSVFLGGNVTGFSTIQLLEKITEKSYLVLELSSWQLSGFHKKRISPHIAVFTSFYPDHLNYYQSLDKYFYDKTAIFRYQTKDDIFIAHTSLREKIRLENPISHVEFYSEYTGELTYLKGTHNSENAQAAAMVGKVLNLDKAIVENTISTFKGLPYRQETIREINTVSFVNDTTSTTPVATIKAIEIFRTQPMALILGGTEKHLPYDDLIDTLKIVKRIVLLKGSFTNKIESLIRAKYKDKVSKTFHSLDDAVHDAYNFIKQYKNSIVLFSPGAASFELFKNEFHRGDEFNKIVNSL